MTTFGAEIIPSIMSTIKSLALALSATVVASACNFQLPFVSREKLEASQNETLQTKQALDSVQSSFARQNEELADILSELSSISGQTTRLQLKVENGSAQLSQTEEIENSLTSVKERIAALEKEAARARKLDQKLAVSAKTIKQLKETVTAQQNEIARLQGLVADREKTIAHQGHVISGQKDTISSQSQTITQQQATLEQTLKEQVEMLYHAGLEFEKLADDGATALDVNGRRDKGKVKEYKKTIYGKALFFYQEAAAQHHESAPERINAVKEKMKALK